MRFDCKNCEAKKNRSPRFKDNRLSPLVQANAQLLQSWQEASVRQPQIEKKYDDDEFIEFGIPRNTQLIKLRK